MLFQKKYVQILQNRKYLPQAKSLHPLFEWGEGDIRENKDPTHW
jgi:hypothetical protein